MYDDLIKRLRNAAGGCEGIRMAHDAADAIAALQAENAEKDMEIEQLRLQRPVHVDGDAIALALELAETKAALNRVEAERDAVVALINKSALKPILECKHYAECYGKAFVEMRIMQCPTCDHWEWRGAQALGTTPGRLRELSKAQDEGRVVVLPCKPSDVTVYQLRSKKHARGMGVSPRYISAATVWGDGDYALHHQGTDDCLKKDLGKTWFLDRNEAEAAQREEGQ